jgi:membrane protein
MAGGMVVHTGKIRAVWTLFRESYYAWLEDNAPSMGAALAFYSILSVAPILVVVTVVAGLGFWRETAEAEVLRHLRDMVGETSAGEIQTAILSAKQTETGVLASIISVGTILIGATGVVVELQDGLNKIWRVKQNSGGSLFVAIRQRLISFSLVMGAGVLLLLSFFSSAALEGVGGFMGQLLPWLVNSLKVGEFLVSLVGITLVLAPIYKLLPDTAIAWSDVWLGAATASLLFTIGKRIIVFYLGHYVVSSTYGALSSPLVVLVWIYYSAQILLFGSEITRTYAYQYGSRNSL